MRDEDRDHAGSDPESELESGDGAPTVDEQKEQYIRHLREAAASLGSSPTKAEFDALDVGVSSGKIAAAFGTWNAAKEAAGLEIRKPGPAAGHGRVAIDETYFEAVETAEKAYWLGTLFARSSIARPKKGGVSLGIVRTEEDRFFVEGFADAIGSEYAISRSESWNNDQPKYQLRISNRTFVDNLFEAGYSGPDAPPADLPTLESDKRGAFVRGYLESSGAFASHGFEIRLHTRQQAETLKEWCTDFGVQRCTVSDARSGKRKALVRISNPFDIVRVFDACWPDVLETTPSFTPYPERVLAHLQREHPYPENVPYLE